MKERQLIIISNDDAFEVYAGDRKKEKMEDLETLLSFLRSADTRDLQQQPLYRNVSEGDKVIIEGYRKGMKEKRNSMIKEMEAYR